MVDEFILYDDVQYTKRDWRNRNLLQTQHGLQWLTIPVRQTNLSQLIKDTKILNKRWAKKHWATIQQNYSKSKHFKEYKDIFEALYLDCDEEYLSQINYRFIVAICKILGITTKIRWSSEFHFLEGQTEKLLGICQECSADIYLSGASAKDYFDMELAKKENIIIEWMDYSEYPEYTQLAEPFEHGVTILDLIFNEGTNAIHYMKSFK